MIGLQWLLQALDRDGDGIPDWGFQEPPEPGEIAQCIADRCAADETEADPRARFPIFPVMDVEDAAANASYANGKNKRKRYRRVNLSKRSVGVVLHQAGAERGESRWERTAHRVTCHRAIGPAGNRYKVHPLDVRLVCSNRLDRKPWHAVGIEVLGNFARVEGGGQWYKPDVFGRGVLGRAQAEALRQEISAIRVELRDRYGATLEWCAPHVVSGKNRRGKPNRPLCCGSAVWAVGEWAVSEFGLAMPGPDQEFGGRPIWDDWHSEYYLPDHRRMAA